MKFSQRDIDGIVVLDVKGKVQGGPEAETFRDLFRNLVKDGKTKVIINLKDVDWISSTGIGIMIRGFKTVREANGDLVMVQVGERTQQVFNVLRLEHIFKIMDNEDEAVQYLKG